MDAATKSRLVALFFAEAEEALPQMEEFVDRLANDEDREAIKEFGRLAHGLKGASAAVGLADLSSIMHGLEQLALDVDAEVGNARTELNQRLARLVRALQATVAEVLASGTAGVSAAAMAGLHSLLDDAPAVLTNPHLRRPTEFPAPETRQTPIAPLRAQGGKAEQSRADADEPRTPVSRPGLPQAPTTGTHAGLKTGSHTSSHTGTHSAQGPGTQTGTQTSERLTVPSEDVDEALGIASTLAREVAALEDEVLAAQSEWTNAVQDISLQADRLETLLFGLRLVPAAEALGGIDTEVAQLSARLGKQARVVVRGHEVRADRRTLQAARGLLRHLIRNALDHGLEAPDARVAAGKTTEGVLIITVQMAENRLVVRVEDNGAGFNVGAIRARMASESAQAAEWVASLSDQEVVQQFAETGGSTRPEATDVSGRGLGLSAVAAAARARGGDFTVRSTPGKGSIISFSLPLEVFATEVLTVTADGRTFGLPLASLEQTVFLGASGQSVQKSPTGMTLAVDERIIPLYPLALAAGASQSTTAGRFAAVVRVDGREAAFGVDELGITTRVVPKAVPPAINADSMVTGVALLPDGSTLQVLNARKLLDAGRGVAAKSVERPATGKQFLDVLLAEDSLATREVLRVLLEEQGYRVRVAGDGEEALLRVAEKVPDVMVSDLNMPRRDGLSLCRAIRANPATARVPFVLLTSQDDAVSQAAGAEAGADAYLIKSRFNADVLRETLRRLGFDA